MLKKHRIMHMVWKHYVHRLILMFMYIKKESGRINTQTLLVANFEGNITFYLV